MSGSTAEQTVEQYNARSLKTFWETTIAKKKEESTTNIHIPKLASRGSFSFFSFLSFLFFLNFIFLRLLRRNKKPDLIQEENLRLQVFFLCFSFFFSVSFFLLLFSFFFPCLMFIVQEMVGELSHQLFDQNRVIEEQQKEIEKLRAQLQAQS